MEAVRKFKVGEPQQEPQKTALRIQYGALPYRWTRTGDLQVMLITSRTRRRWIIPKGWPIKGLNGWETAATEAQEEAGVRGIVSKRAVGSFRYDKLLDEDGETVPCEVTVFPLRVKRSLKSWQEQAQRVSRWFTPLQAVAVAADAGLRDLIASFASGSVAAWRSPENGRGELCD